MLERVYQKRIIDRLYDTFEDCIVLKNDSGYLQGIPDLTILYGQLWGMLEVKVSADSIVQPNQDYYVEMLNGMGFAAFVYPEIEDEVFRALQSALQPRRNARVSQRKQVLLG